VSPSTTRSTAIKSPDGISAFSTTTEDDSDIESFEYVKTPKAIRKEVKEPIESTLKFFLIKIT
jgi:hypothetical protein